MNTQIKNASLNSKFSFTGMIKVRLYVQNQETLLKYQIIFENKYYRVARITASAIAESVITVQRIIPDDSRYTQVSCFAGIFAKILQSHALLLLLL